MAGQVHRLMAGLAAASNGMLQVQRGKYVAELKPAGFDKGSAIEEYLAESPFHGRRPVFLGDDLTDEQGFAAINRRDGISVKVGKGPSIAHYRLPNVAAVRDWLGTLLDRHPSAP
jgi:trehalose 6-phosphate phosphatase